MDVPPVLTLGDSGTRKGRKEREAGSCECLTFLFGLNPKRFVEEPARDSACPSRPALHLPPPWETDLRITVRFLYPSASFLHWPTVGWWGVGSKAPQERAGERGGNGDPDCLPP